jgi:hypothetical protein
MPKSLPDFSIKAIAFSALAAILAGCAGSEGFPATSKVTGKVTYSGAAVAGAAVSYSPVGNGNAAAGVTDATGTYTLTTFRSGDGAVPGKYKVIISKTEQAVTVETAVGTAEDPSAAYAAAEARGADVFGTGRKGGGGAAKADTGPRELLPVKYKNVDSTDLQAEVTSAGPNNFDFDLKP